MRKLGELQRGGYEELCTSSIKKPFVAFEQNTSQYSSFRSKLWVEKLEIQHIGKIAEMRQLKQDCRKIK